MSEFADACPKGCGCDMCPCFDDRKYFSDAQLATATRIQNDARRANTTPVLGVSPVDLKVIEAQDRANERDAALDELSQLAQDTGDPDYNASTRQERKP